MSSTNQPSQPEKMSLESMSITDHQKAKLKELFPEVFTEGSKIDFEQLKRTLGEVVDGGKERFGMQWAGKADCFKTIQQPSVATLVPVPEESIDFDTTENVFIEGDNLEVLKLLQKSYLGKIKMIYIDPPYNTGNDFIYPDNYSENLDTYLEYTGQIDGEGRKFSTNVDTDGRFHSKWMNMMYSRLFLAKNLLRDDGVIAIHIDEHEYTNLDKLLFEIFGSENNLGTIVWDKRNPKGDAKGVAYQHEYIVFYTKNKNIFLDRYEFVRPKQNATRMFKKVEQLIKEFGLNDNTRAEYKNWLKYQHDLSGGERAYSLIDEEGNIYRPVSMAWPNKKKAPDDYFVPLIHPITNKQCPLPERGWRNPSATMQELLKNNQILFGEDESTQPTRKYLLKENINENISSLLYFGGSDDELLKEFGISFENPKVVDVSKKLINSIAKDKDIVLDFFAGSATTAHAVMDLNKDDGLNRKYICIQLPEPTDEKSEAFKAGYNTIAEISKERIRRASAKIKAEAEVSADLLTGQKKPLDLGFRVFKLQKSNFKVWDATLEKDAANIQLALEEHIDHIDPNATQQAILFELLLKAGFELTTPIETLTLANKTVFSIAEGALLICLERALTLDLIKAIADLAASQSTTRVIVLDEGFQNNDQLKTNASLTLKAKGVVDFRTV